MRSGCADDRKRHRGSELRCTSGTHDDHTRRQRQRLDLIMRHEQRRDSQLGLQLLDLDAHLFTQLRIQVAERLVQERSSGSITNARASATRCCCPPLS